MASSFAKARYPTSITRQVLLPELKGPAIGRNSFDDDRVELLVDAAVLAHIADARAKETSSHPE